MARLFDLKDEDEEHGSKKAIVIPALVRFAKLKGKRLDGLIAHASYQISTGKLERFNNRINGAKNINLRYNDFRLDKLRLNTSPK